MIKLNSVRFPDVVGQRHYMRPFLKADGLPFDLKEWQPTVDAMLEGVDTDCPIFLMVDQRYIEVGGMLRRPGVHIDGHWIPSLHAHGGRGTPGHGGTPAPIYRDEAPVKKKPIKPTKKKPEPKAPELDPNDWGLSGDGYDEGLILASNIAGCIAYDGLAEFVNNGDCSHVDVSKMSSDALVGGFAYGLDAFQLHQSVPQLRSGYRTLVRLNVTGWRP